MANMASYIDLKNDTLAVKVETYNVGCHDHDSNSCHQNNVQDILPANETSGKKRWAYMKDFVLSAVTPLAPQRWPVVFTWIVLALVLVVFSGELLYSKETLGEFLELEPFNFMIGPSVQILVQCGARYTPCMRNTTFMPPNERYVCLNMTHDTALLAATMNTDAVTLFDPATATALEGCSLEDVCGFGGFSNPKIPDQSFRFLTPLFVHMGVFHCALDIALLLLIGCRLEPAFNGLRMTVIFVTSGLFGNVLGSIFAPSTAPYLGCSPGLFGLLASLYVDLAYRWRLTSVPIYHLIRLLIVTGASLILGLLPGVDTYSNVGGFLSGILVGLIAVPAETSSSRSYLYSLWLIRSLSSGLLFSSFALMLNTFFGDNYDQ